jgi:hypothetical protein
VIEWRWWDLFIYFSILLSKITNFKLFFYIVLFFRLGSILSIRQEREANFREFPIGSSPHGEWRWRDFFYLFFYSMSNIINFKHYNVIFFRLRSVLSIRQERRRFFTNFREFPIGSSPHTDEDGETSFLFIFLFYCLVLLLILTFFILYCLFFRLGSVLPIRQECSRSVSHLMANKGVKTFFSIYCFYWFYCLILLINFFLDYLFFRLGSTVPNPKISFGFSFRNFNKNVTFFFCSFLQEISS